MKPFTYHYHETTHNAVAESFMEDANQRYQITLDNGECLVIAAAGWLTPDGRTVWIQSEKPDEITYPHEMVQAIGEGMKMDEKLSSKQNVSIENNVNSHGLKRTIPDPIKRE